MPVNNTECITDTEDVCRVVELAKEVEECSEELVDQCKPVSKKHVKTVDEDVCKDELVDVVEEICDGEDENKVDIDSYGPPNAPLVGGGSIESHGPPKAPLVGDKSIDSYGPPQAPLLAKKCRQVEMR